MNDAFGISLLAILWGLTLVGVLFKTWFAGKYDTVSTVIYLVMGWMMIAGGRRFFNNLPVPVVIMLIIGGGLYTIGVVFYKWDRYTYTHSVWHIFVIAAAVCHYTAVLLAM